MSTSKSIDCYASHGAKREWIAEYLKLRDDFAAHNGLGSNMVRYFNRFLLDSGLAVDKKFSVFADKIANVGFETEAGLGLLLTNLSYSPQVGWYIRNINWGQAYSRTDFVSLLCNYNISETVASKMVGSFERLLNLFQPVGLGEIAKKGRIIDSFTRGTWESPDPRVVLYAMYKFAEVCDGYYQFSLSRLMDFSIDSDGISPAQIFGIDEAKLTSILRGLSVQYPDYISYSETLGLQTIDLRKSQTAADVLSLF